MKRRSATGIAFVLWVAGASTALAAEPGKEPSRPGSTAVVVNAPDGFDWSDAAVGAAAGAGAVLAATGATTLARNK